MKGRIVTLHAEGPHCYSVHLNHEEVGTIFQFLGTWHINPHSRGFRTADEASEKLVDIYLKTRQETIS